MLEYENEPIIHDQYIENYCLGYTIGVIESEKEFNKKLKDLKKIVVSEEQINKIQMLEERINNDEYKKDRLSFYNRYASLSIESIAKKIWKESEYWQGSNLVFSQT